MKKRIALDVEGVIANIHQLLIEYLNRLYKVSLTIEDISDWYFGDKIRGLGLTPTDCIEVMSEIWRNRWQTVPTTESYIGNKVFKLYERHKVDIVTARKEREIIERWLEANSIPYHDFIVEERKENLDYDIFIDDNPNLYKNLPKDRIQFLYDRPWNRMANETVNCVRVYNFDDILCKLIFLS